MRLQVCTDLSATVASFRNCCFGINKNFTSNYIESLPNSLLRLGMIRGADHAYFATMTASLVLGRIARNMVGVVPRPEGWDEPLYGVKQEAHNYLLTGDLDHAMSWFKQGCEVSARAHIHGPSYTTAFL